MALRAPPGRAGRLWLARRLAVADRAADLLEQKRKALVGEQRRLRLLVAKTEEDWRTALAEAERWYGRAVVATGRSQVRRPLAYLEQPTIVGIRWGATMGAHYPARISCRFPPEVPVVELSGTAAAAPVTAAYKAALEAAAQHAAATLAQRRVEEELTVTVRRLRVIERRWRPELAEALRELDLWLDEHEREDVVTARWAVEQKGDR